LSATVFAAPIYNATFNDVFGCPRVAGDYIILADAGSTSDFSSNVFPALRILGLGLLRLPNVNVGFCTYSNILNCGSFAFTNIESQFLASISSSLNPSSFLANPDPAIQGAMANFIHSYQPSNIILIQTSNQASSTYAARARDAGIQIYAIGLIPASTVSYPSSTNYIYANTASSMTQAATQLLQVIRNQQGNTCYAYGFGQSHILTFDGVLYDFAGVGDYYLFDSSDNGEDPLTVQVRQITRPNSQFSSQITQIRAVAISFYGNTYLAQYDPDIQLLTISINGYPLDLNNDFGESTQTIPSTTYSSIPTSIYYTYSSVTITITQINPSNGYNISFVANSGAKVLVYYSDYGSSVSISPVGTAFGASSGLCGYFDSCALNDFTLRDGTILKYNEATSNSGTLNSFIENWRVTTKFDSLFGLQGFEAYYPPNGWSPYSTKKTHQTAGTACQGLPPAIQATCVTDVNNRQHAYASLPSRFFFLQICQQYCTNPLIALPYAFDPAGYCQLTCNSIYGDININQVYNSTYVPPPVVFRSGYNSALFKPIADVGGSYTYMLRAYDLCSDNQRNVTFQITCNPPPSVNAYSFYDSNENNHQGPLSSMINITGTPTILLVGSISQTPNSKISWAVINATLPLFYTNDSYFPLQERLNALSNSITYSNSLYAFFTPLWIGTFLIELSVNDGCQVTNSTVQVQVQCGTCSPISRINTFQKNTWNKFNSNSGYWQNFEFTLDTIGIDPYSLLNYQWNLIAKDGNPIINETSSGVYNIYQIISPEIILFTNNTSFYSQSTPSVSSKTNGYPFVQSVVPYTVPELKVVTTTITWTDTTTTITEQVVIPENISSICKVSINSPTSENPTVAFTDPANLNTQLAMCTGFYTFQAITSDGCQPLGGRQVNDSVVLQLDCGLPPSVYISCSADSVFIYDFGDGSFPTVTLDGSETYDPRVSDNNNGLVYSWSLISAPSTSTATIFDSNVHSNSNSFTPDTKGTFVISFTASNQCNENTAVVTVTATCASPPLPTVQATSTTLNYNGNYGFPTFSLNGTASFQYPNSLTYFWTITSPSIPSQIAFFVQSPVFNDKHSPTTALSLYYGGTYTVTVTAYDSCQPGVNATGTLNFLCPGTISLIVNNIGSINYDYTTQGFPSFTLNGSSSTLADAPYAVNSIQGWYLVSSPTNTPTTPEQVSSSSTATQILQSPGSTVYRFIYSDGCQYDYSDVTVVGVCTNTPNAVPVIFSQGGGSQTVGTPFTLGDNSGQTYSSINWILLSSPYNQTATSSFFNFTYTASYPGTYVFQETVFDGCSTAKAQITVIVNCPNTNYSTNAVLSTSTSNFYQGKFGIVQMYDTGSNLASIPSNNFIYRWIITSAPVGSIYQPYDVTNSTLVTTQTTQTISGPTNTTIYTTYTNQLQYTRIIRYVEIQNSPNPYQTFASCFYPDLPGTYTARLTISLTNLIDDVCFSKNSSDLSITATCNNPPTPVVSNQNINLQPNQYTRVILDASKSTDSDGDPLTFYWSFNSSLADNYNLEQITSHNSPLASIVISIYGTYLIQLSIFDGCQTVNTTVTITANCLADDLSKQEQFTQITSKYNGMQIAYDDFEYIDKIAPELCTDNYEWTLVGYSNPTYSPSSVSFRQTPGFLATVIVVPIVGVILIGGVIAFVLFKTGVVGGTKSGNTIPMKPWGDDS